jgi:alanine racemase
VNHPSQILLSKQAFLANWRFIQDLVGPQVRVSSVVKGNAYGHGIEDFVPMAWEIGVRHFSVHSLDEAMRVRTALSPEKPEVMIMGYVDDADVTICIAESISFFVFDQSRLQAAIGAAVALGIPAKIHLELETGFNRTGFAAEELPEVARRIQQAAGAVVVEGICTHLAGAESIANHVRVQAQLKKFNVLTRRLARKGIEAPRHTACSAAAVVYSATRMDMVRIGIMQYGFWPSKETLLQYLNRYDSTARHDPLRRVIAWQSKVLSTKQVQPGDFIGYGTSYLAQHPMTIAAIPVGYSHGYSRSLSNLGRVVIHDKSAMVVGLVNMNMMMVDITEIPEVRKGDPVWLIGGNGPAQVSVAAFSELSHQLNYELLTRLPMNIPRIITD